MKKTLFQYCQDLTDENKQLKKQIEEIRKSQKITFDTLKLTDKAFAFAVDYLQNEYNENPASMEEVIKIMNYGEEFFLKKAEESLK